MDLIGEIANRIGLDRGTAEALAGTILEVISAQLQGQQEQGASAELNAAIPEMQQWQQAAHASPEAGAAPGAPPSPTADDTNNADSSDLAPSDDGGLFGLLDSALVALGFSGQPGLDASTLSGILREFNLQPQLASQLAPLVLTFLQERLPPPLLAKVQASAPLLKLGLAASASGLLNHLRRSPAER